MSSECRNCFFEGVNPAAGSSHILAESLAVVSAGEVKMAVEVEVIRRQLRHPQDGPLTLLCDWLNVILLLRLPHQGLLQTGDHLTLGVDVLARKREEGNIEKDV